MQTNLIILRHRLIRISPDLIVIACCLVSLVLSVIESRFNTDAHHWGLMYGNAADLHQGLIPYREIFIQYGILTTLIQSLSLNIFGNTVVAVGIITGIFYSINIYLSYCLWQKILNKWLSSISSVLMFLVHSYILYPWSNYFSYTFILASLLFITSSPRKKYRYLFAGVFVGLSLLARQSFLTILTPFYPYFLLLLFVSPQKEFWRLHCKNIILFHIGLIFVLAVFWLYLLQVNAVTDWEAQTFTILKAYNLLHSASLSILLYDLTFGYALGGPDTRAMLYSIIFFNTLIIWIKSLFTAIKKTITEKDKILFLFSSVIVLGYVNSLHIYEVFRLQNSSSLGFGLLILSLDNLSNKMRKGKRLIFTIPVVFIFIYLSQTLLFTSTSSVYYPWNRDLLLSNQLKEPENIEILKGKLYDDKMKNYYQVLAQTITKYSSNCQLEYLVNLSTNSYIPFLEQSLKKVQRSPFYSRLLEDKIFQDEKAKIDELLKQEKAILIASDTDSTFKEIPKEYKVVIEVSVPYFIPLTGTKTYVAVPKNINCQN